MCVRNTSKWERKYPAQQSQPPRKHCLEEESRKPPGAQCPAAPERRASGKSRELPPGPHPLNSGLHTKLWFLVLR